MPTDSSVTQIYRSGRLHVACFNPGRAQMVVTFDNWRRERQGFPELRASAVFGQAGVTQMIIHTAANDWFLSPELPMLREALLEATRGYQRVTALGFSMGGFGALLLSRALRLNRVLLVSPQVSIFAGRAPYETRYLKEAARLDPALDDLDRHPRRGLRGVVLFDPMDRIDRQHARAISALHPRLAMVALAFGGHPATVVLREGWKFRKLQEELLRTRLRPDYLLRGHKRARRNSPTYWAALEARCADRGQRE